MLLSFSTWGVVVVPKNVFCSLIYTETAADVRVVVLECLLEF